MNSKSLGLMVAVGLVAGFLGGGLYQWLFPPQTVVIQSASTAVSDSGPNLVGEVPQALGGCADSIKEFCANVMPGGGRMIQCLEKNTAALSRACTKNIDAAKKKLRQGN